MLTPRDPARRSPDFHGELGDAPVLVTSRVTPLFSREECAAVVRAAEEHYAGSGGDGRPRGWPTGFWIKDGPPAIKAWAIKA